MHLSAGSHPADDWTAFGTVGLLVVAVVAALFARAQLEEARTARQAASKDAHDLLVEQVQPNVVLYTEHNPAEDSFIDLVMKNFGQTIATDVRSAITPAPQRSPKASRDGQTEAVAWPALVLTLAPGQEIRTFWDVSFDRVETDLPDLHQATVDFTDSRGRPLSTESRLDWSIYKTRRWVDVRGTHHLAKATEEISRTLKSFGETDGHGAAVYERSGDEKDDRRRRQSDRIEALNDQLEAEAQPTDGASEETP